MLTGAAERGRVAVAFTQRSRSKSGIFTTPALLKYTHTHTLTYVSI